MRQGLWAVAVMVGVVTLVGPAEGATVDELRAQFVKKSAACGKELADLAKWCERKKHAGAAARFRGAALWFRPDDKKLRKSLGWTRNGDAWEWPEPARSKFRAAALDTPLPAGDDFAKQLAKTRAKGVKRLLALAKDAVAPPAASDDVTEAMDAIRAETLALALRLDPSRDDVRKALGHTKHEGRLVHPDGVEYLESRAESRVRGTEVAQRAAGAEMVDGATAGALPRAATDSLWMTCATSASLAKSVAERATQVVRVLEDVYGMPDAFRFHIERRDFVLVENEDQRMNVLQQFQRRGDRMLVRTEDKTLVRFGKMGLLILEPDADEATQVACAAAARVGVATLFTIVFDEAEEATRKPEAWVQDAMTMDVLERALGTIHPTLGIELRKAKSGSRRSGADWLERARVQFDHGDDPSMAQVAAAGPWKIGSHELAKGYAFLRFVFESEPEKASEFALGALVFGAEAAAKDLFGRSLADMEEDYAEWLRVTR